MVKILLSKTVYLFLIANCINLATFGQYNSNYVETYSNLIGGETYSIVKMSRKDNHVKAKYFASKDYNGTSVYQRYTEWARNKNIISISSGTYMDNCLASIALPVGLCIDNGVPVNNTLRDDLDALVIVYATGGIAVSNLDEKNLTVTYTSTKVQRVLDIRNAFDRTEFVSWAKAEGATVFQSHLFCYKNVLQINSNAPSDRKKRRFLAGCKDDKGTVYHFIVNLSNENSLYDATVEVKDYLLNANGEDMSEIVYMFNLDPGCQNYFEVKKIDGSRDTRLGFQGELTIDKTANLIVYYSTNKF